MKTNYIVVYVTAPPGQKSRKVAKALISSRLAACVNIIPKVESFYHWKGKVEKDAESLLIIKSRLPLLPRIIAKVRSIHPYESPEIIALPIEGGFVGYLNWISKETK